MSGKRPVSEKRSTIKKTSSETVSEDVGTSLDLLKSFQETIDRLSRLENRLSFLEKDNTELRDTVQTLQDRLDVFERSDSVEKTEHRTRVRKSGTILDRVISKHVQGKFVSLKPTLTPINFSTNNELKGNLFYNVFVDDQIVCGICYIPTIPEQAAVKAEMEKYCTLQPYTATSTVIKTSVTEKKVVVESE